MNERTTWREPEGSLILDVCVRVRRRCCSLLRLEVVPKLSPLLFGHGQIGGPHGGGVLWRHVEDVTEPGHWTKVIHT